MNSNLRFARPRLPPILHRGPAPPLLGLSFRREAPVCFGEIVPWPIKIFTLEWERKKSLLRSPYLEIFIVRTRNPEGGAMNRTNEYRAKAFECLSLAETVNDPERRADLVRFARMWMSLSEPLPDMRSAYEVKRASH